MIMAVISQGPSNAASKAAASSSSKPTTVKMTNSRNKKSAVNDIADEDDLSDEEMNDKQSDSDDYEVLCPSAVCLLFCGHHCHAFCLNLV